jgi:hypothetical protein
MLRRSRSSHAFWAIVIAGMCAPTSVATAQEASGVTSSLSWVRLPGTDSCIAGRELGQRVERRLGRAVFTSTSRADLAVEGRVEHLPGRRGFRATIVATRHDGTTVGEKVLSATDCSQLDDEVVLVMALMIDPDATGEEPPHKDETPASAPRIDIVEVQGPERPSPPWRGHVLVGSGLSVGLLPGVRPTLNVAVGLDAPSRWGVALDGVFVLPSRDSMSGLGADASLELLAAYAGAAVCYGLADHRPLNFAICLGPRFGLLRATPSGVASPTAKSELLVNVVSRLRMRWEPFRLLAIGAELGPELPLSRHCFSGSEADVQSLQTIRSEAVCTGRVGAVGWIGLGLALP